MKLCRFELIGGPPGVRTGIFADRIYETQGLTGVGIHEQSKVRILTPTGQLTSVRVPLEPDVALLSPTGMLGPLGDFDFPAKTRKLDVEVRPAVVLREAAERIEASEAESLVLGYTILFSFVTHELVNEAPIRARDFVIVVGPFITTPEELDDLRLGGAGDLRFGWAGSLSVNGEQRAAVSGCDLGGFAEHLAAATQGHAVTSADLIAIDRVPFPPLASTSLGRSLQPGDSIQATLDPLGTLVVRIV